MGSQVILNMARKTPGDKSFFTRWESLGVVHKTPFSVDPKIVTIIVTDQYMPITEKLMERFPQVKVICSATTGENHLFKGGPPIITLKGETRFLETISSTAEHTLYLLLRLYKEVLPTQELQHKTIGLIGYGRIGKQVSKMCKGLRMNVMTYDKWFYHSPLYDVFNYSDIVSIHLSLNEETERGVDNKCLSLMSPQSCFINTARADIVDEESLYVKLQIGAIGAAALDVTNIPEKFNALPNVIVTPHIAGRSIESRLKTDLFLIEKLKRFLRV